MAVERLLGRPVADRLKAAYQFGWYLFYPLGITCIGFGIAAIFFNVLEVIIVGFACGGWLFFEARLLIWATKRELRNEQRAKEIRAWIMERHPNLFPVNKKVDEGENQDA
jgi:hypothetical protein